MTSSCKKTTLVKGVRLIFNYPTPTQFYQLTVSDSLEDFCKCTGKKTRRNTSTSLGPVQAQLALHGRVAKINCRPVSQNGIYGPFATTER